MEKDERLLWILGVVPVVYTFAYFHGHKVGERHGEGMMEIARKVTLNNMREANNLHNIARQLNMEVERIENWKIENGYEE